jgi:adenosylcobinamide-phosphate synthase
LSVLPIAIALALDFILGDPPSEWHPVRVLGRQIDFLEAYCRTLPVNPRTQGCVFLALNMFLFLLPIALISFAFSFIAPLGVLVNGVLIYFAMGGTCLAREIGVIADSLSRSSVFEAREKLSGLVSRDVGSMDEAGIASSAIETLSENFSDSAVATLLYAAVGGPVLAWIHRISNTLDAMAGYKTEAYIDFGYASAKLDDILNFIPSRVSAVVVALASKSCGGNLRETLKCALDCGSALDSPNAGYPIAAFAGALNVRLCGPTSYFGVMRNKPYIGSGARPDLSDLCRAIPLYWNSYALASVLSFLLAWICR